MVAAIHSGEHLLEELEALDVSVAKPELAYENSPFWKRLRSST